MLIEGDILVPKDFFENKACYATNFWPNGIVYYEFDLNVNQVQAEAMLLAMAEWENVADLQFVVRTNQDDFIHIFSAAGNFSQVGMVGGMQELGIINWDWKFIMAHELCHALGFYHEQSRADRDSYVQINPQCIDLSEEKLEINFGIHDDAGYYGYYDFLSVMHYRANAFYNPNLEDCTEPYSITVLPPYQEYQDLIGQRDSLTYLDKITMSFAYPDYWWRFVVWDPTVYGGGIGTFIMPFMSNNIYFVVSVFLIQDEVLWIQPGSYFGNGVYNKAVTLRAPLGNVSIGY